VNEIAHKLRDASHQIQHTLTFEQSLSRGSCFSAADLMDEAADEIEVLEKKAYLTIKLPRGLRWMANV
jgi:hypothetical protein